MKIVNTAPPEWIMQGCLNQFRVNVEHTFWTYGDAIYNPGGHPIPAHIVAHEEQHSRQQETYETDDTDARIEDRGDYKAKIFSCGHELRYPTGGKRTPEEEFEINTTCKTCFESPKDAWWRNYLANPRFRLEQEAEAYGMQYRYICDHDKDRNRRARMLMELGGQLAGPLYQVALTQLEARKMIEILAGQRALPER